jgi:hypothetical protein
MRLPAIPNSISPYKIGKSNKLMLSFMIMCIY